MEKIEQNELKEKILTELQIDESNIRGSLIKHPMQLFYWAYQASLANQVAMQMKTAVKQLEAQTASTFRESNTINQKRVTDTQAIEYVNRNQEVIDAKNRLTNSIFVSDVLTDAKYAFIQKGKILLTLASGLEPKEEVDPTLIERS